MRLLRSTFQKDGCRRGMARPIPCRGIAPSGHFHRPIYSEKSFLMPARDKRDQTNMIRPNRHRNSWLGILVLMASLLCFACSSDSGDTTTQSTPTTRPVLSEPPLPSKDERLASIGDAVSKIRELPFVDKADVMFVDAGLLAETRAKGLENAEVRADIVDSERLLKLLGLIPLSSNLLEIESRLLELSTSGAYDYESGVLQMLDEAEELSVKQEAVYSHEYAHLLQDANFDLSELYKSVNGDSDREMALQALIDGEATFVESTYAAQNISVDDVTDLVAIDPKDRAVLQGTPVFLILSLNWPYSAGYAFAKATWQYGGMTALDAVWRDLPKTTEQILHPDKYRANEFPKIPLKLPDLTTVLGDGWMVTAEDVLGEAGISLWLEASGVQNSAAAQAASGWGRDAYAVLTGPNGGSAMGLLIEWDEPNTDSVEFSSAFEQAMNTSPIFTKLLDEDVTVDSWDGPSGVLSVALDGITGDVGVVVAPTPELAELMLNVLVTE